MAVLDFSRLISFKQWFDRTNQLGSNTGDPAVINSDLGSNLVNAINVVHTDLGNKAALNTDVTTNLVEAMNDLNQSISRFRLNEGEPQAYDMHPQAVFGTDSDFDAHGMVE